MQFQRQIPKRTRYQAIEQFATASVVLATSLVMLCGIPIDRKFNFNLIPAVPLRRCFLRDNPSGERRIGGFSRKKKTLQIDKDCMRQNRFGDQSPFRPQKFISTSLAGNRVSHFMKFKISFFILHPALFSLIHFLQSRPAGPCRIDP